MAGEEGEMPAQSYFPVPPPDPDPPLETFGGSSAAAAAPRVRGEESVLRPTAQVPLPSLHISPSVSKAPALDTIGASALTPSAAPLAVTPVELGESTASARKMFDLKRLTANSENFRNLSQAGTMLQQAAQLSLVRASSLPVDDDELRHAATMPTLMDLQAVRPWCGGLWKTQQLIGFTLGIGFFIFFNLARFVKEYPVANDMVAITALVSTFWVFEVVPIYVTALLPIVLMPLGGITSTEIVANSYWNWVQMLIIGVFLMDAAMESVQLPRRLTILTLRQFGHLHPGLLLASFMVLSWLVSMCCSDIAATLMIAPFATGLLNTSEEEACVADRAAVAKTAQPNHGDTGPGSVGGEEEGVGPRTREVHRFSCGVMLAIAYSATIGGIATIVGAPQNSVLAGYSILAGQVSFGKWFLFAFPISACILVLTYIVLYMQYVRGVCFALSREALEAEHALLLREVGPLSRDEILVGLVQLLQILFLVFQPWTFEKWVTSRADVPLTKGATTACGCAMLLFLLPSKARPGEALLTWKVAHQKVPWGVLLLVGGGFAIGQGFTESGLDNAAGKALGHLFASMHPLLVDFTVIAITTLMTQIACNVATVSLMLPILSSACLTSVTNPLKVMLPCTVACAFSFTLPTSTPSNAVVLAKSRDLAKSLSFRHFLGAGIPLMLLAIVFGSLLTSWMARLVFDAEAPFPAFACGQVNCMWLPIAGEVNGRLVNSQACMVLDSYDEVFCELWNGTHVNLTTLVGL